MSKRTIFIFVCIGLIVVGFVVIACYQLGRADEKWATEARLQQYFRHLLKVDRELTTDLADKSFVHGLQPGNYILEIYRPPDVFSNNLTITFTNGSYVFISSPGSTSSVLADIQVVGDTIKWSWDYGYSGSDDYIGYIQPDCLIGNVYTNYKLVTRVAKWVIRKKNKGE